jgi:hypothetical protein
MTYDWSCKTKDSKMDERLEKSTDELQKKYESINTNEKYTKYGLLTLGIGLAIGLIAIIIIF